MEGRLRLDHFVIGAEVIQVQVDVECHVDQLHVVVPRSQAAWIPEHWDAVGGKGKEKEEDRNSPENVVHLGSKQVESVPCRRMPADNPVVETNDDAIEEETNNHHGWGLFHLLDRPVSRAA